MNKRIYGMAPGGRMSLDRAENRRRIIWMNQRRQWPRERKGALLTNSQKFCKIGGEENGSC